MSAYYHIEEVFVLQKIFLEIKEAGINLANKMNRPDMAARMEDAVTPNEIIGIAIAILVMAAILPTALTSFFDANTTGWDSATVLLWGIVPLIVIAVIVMKWYGKK